MRIFKHIFLSSRFFAIGGLIVFLYLLSFAFPSLMAIAHTVLLLLLANSIVDGIILFRKKQPPECRRKIPNVLSLGDENKITLSIHNTLNFKIHIKILEELPYQLNIRDFSKKINLEANERRNITYTIRPVSRGKYQFGNVNLFFSSSIKLITRRHIMQIPGEIAVFPSVLQMKKYELLAIRSTTHYQGLKRIRKIGHSYEFEQIKTYVPGDDTRSINWKASSRTGTVMVNQYEDERSQPVYAIIDRSRSMLMPFNELSLLDYSINTSLAISNIVLKKHDKAGLLTFSNRIGNVIKAEKHHRQLHKILNALYSTRESTNEANYELLYSAVRSFIRGRSLLFLYTNFESIYALKRVLSILRKINKLHLLVVMFFENTELKEYTSSDAENFLDIYQKTAARKFLEEKQHIVQELHRHGIQTIKSKPEDLSINTINKYLELKSRGHI